MMPVRWITLAAALVLGGCALSRQSAPPHPLAGCYTVRAGEWMIDTASARLTDSLLMGPVHARSFDLPPLMELTMQPSRGRTGVFVPTFQVRTPGHRSGYDSVVWWDDDARRVAVVWTSNGWDGYRLEGIVRNDTLQGRVQAFSDVVFGIEPFREVRAVRVACPANRDT